MKHTVTRRPRRGAVPGHRARHLASPQARLAKTLANPTEAERHMQRVTQGPAIAKMRLLVLKNVLGAIFPIATVDAAFDDEAWAAARADSLEALGLSAGVVFIQAWSSKKGE